MLVDMGGLMGMRPQQPRERGRPLTMKIGPCIAGGKGAVAGGKP